MFPLYTGHCPRVFIMGINYEQKISRMFTVDADMGDHKWAFESSCFPPVDYLADGRWMPKVRNRSPAIDQNQAQGMYVCVMT